MAETEDHVDLEENLSQVALALFSSGSVEGTLQHIVELAESTVDGCDAAGLLFLDEGQASTGASGTELATALDQRQIEIGEGPCLDASNQGSTLYVEDLANERRWPVFTHEAVAMGVRCVLTYSLSLDRSTTLSLYSRFPGAFEATGRAQGQLFATLARIALDTAQHRESDERKAANLGVALETRELIGQAQGILMERERISSDQAFDVLRRASQRMNVKLRDVAESLTETGESPSPPGPA